MLPANKQLGTTSIGTSFPDIIMSAVSMVSDGRTPGFQSFLHDPKSLNETVNAIQKMTVPSRFIEAVMARRLATQKINDCWKCPLNLQTPLTCPLAWSVTEAKAISTIGNTEFQFQLMRTIDFLGRNYIRIELPEVDTTQITINGKVNDMSDPANIFLGAWHRDLVPRIIDTVTFYPRSSQHSLFAYSGYDIAIHNIIFGNANKEMNDLMAGEDKFELTYDPYRVDGTALGIASFKGVDAYKEFEYSVGDDGTGSFNTAAAANSSSAMLVGDIYNVASQAKQTDGFIDYFQRDKSMDIAEYRTYYRRNVWYEAPVAVPYDARHSIHSRRIVHERSVIIIPLDVLPFGYSVESSLPTAALAGDCGFISIKLFNNWFDRSFYLTRMSDVPTLYPIAQHRHYANGDACYEFDYENCNILTGEPSLKLGTVTDESGLAGWVNVRSLGRFNDPEFDVAAGESLEDDREQTHARPQDQVIGKQTQLEGVVPVTMKPNQGVFAPAKKEGAIKTKGQAFTSVSRAAIQAASSLDFETKETSLLIPPSFIDKSFADAVSREMSLKLLQVGYLSLDSIKQLLIKLPNIYLTTEWADANYELSAEEFTIRNDLYTMAIAFWFIPHDVHEIPSMRVYPHQKIDTEAPIIAGMTFKNEQSQGTTCQSWDMMNLQTPAHMGLKPLLSNMGILSFTPLMQPNQMPYAIYDQNLSGYISCKYEKPNGTSNHVNLKKGSLKVVSIGVNGIALVNMNMFRLIF